MTLPELRTARLELKPFHQDDIDSLHRFWTDPGVRRYLWDDEIISRSRAAGVIEASIASAESNGVGMWSIRLSGGAEIIGFCGFRGGGEDRVELLYGIHPSHQGRGLATEASQSALDYAFHQLGLMRVIAGADKPNRASIRVMEKLGFRFEEARTNSGRDEEWWAVTASPADPGFSATRRRTASPSEPG